MQTLRPRRHHQLFLHSLSKHGAQTGCMFSVLKATEKHVESHQKNKRPAFDKYAAAVASFVESYIAANKAYPKIAEVVRGTGGTKSTIRRILLELNLENNVLRCNEVCAKGPDDMEVRHTIRSVTECMLSSNINSKNSAWPCSDKFEQLAQEVGSAQMEASVDSMDTICSETECMLSNNINSKNAAWPCFDKFEQLAQEVGSAQVGASFDIMDTETDNEGIGISAQKLGKKGFPSLPNPAVLTVLDQALHSSNKADANRRVAPLMEVLQQKSSGSSRRVHLSACGGIENDLSWDKTLLSIMPTLVGGKEETSGLKDEQPKVDRESMGHTASSSENRKESSETSSDLNYTVKVMSSKAKSILSALSGVQLQNALKREAKVFQDLKNVKMFTTMGNTFAILQFKNNKSMEKALKLKTVSILGEHLSLQESLVGTVDSETGDYTQQAGLGKGSVFQEVMQLVGSLRKKDASSEFFHSPTYSSAKDKKSDVCMQAQPILRFLKTITIQDCPRNIPLESIESFFSVFGEVQTSCGALTADDKRTVLIEFENESGKQNALKVRRFTVDGCTFQISPNSQWGDSSSVTVQLKREGSGVDVKTAVNTCRKYGSVEKVLMRKNQTLEVMYEGEGKQRYDKLLKSLDSDPELKGQWKPLPVYDGYIRAHVYQAWRKEKVKTVLLLLKQLVNHLTDMLAMNEEILNELAVGIKNMSAASKVM